MNSAIRLYAPNGRNSRRETPDWTRVLRSDTLDFPGSTGFGHCPIGTGNFNHGPRRFNTFPWSVRASRSGALDEALARRARQPTLRSDERQRPRSPRGAAALPFDRRNDERDRPASRLGRDARVRAKSFPFAGRTARRPRNDRMAEQIASRRRHAQTPDAGVAIHGGEIGAGKGAASSRTIRPKALEEVVALAARTNSPRTGR